MLSWPGWLTYRGRFTHISGHLSATRRAQDRESSSAKDRRPTAEPRNQPYLLHATCRYRRALGALILNLNSYSQP